MANKTVIKPGFVYQVILHGADLFNTCPQIGHLERLRLLVAINLSRRTLQVLFLGAEGKPLKKDALQFSGQIFK